MSMKNPNIHTPPHGHNPSAPVHSGTAGLPLGYDDRAQLKAAMSKSKGYPCFGGKLFYAKDYLNNTLICHAIQCTNAEQTTALSQWYHFTRRLHNVAFLPYERSINIGGGMVVYSFAISSNYISMRQLMERADRAKYSKDLFKKLLDLLWNYSQEIGKHYAALLSISLDTVFMDNKGRLYLLPLLCINNQFPKGYPLEAGTEEADDRSDVYTAALLALQVASGCEYESRAENKRMRPEEVSDEVMRCLCIFPSGRHNLIQARNVVHAAAPAAPVKSGPKSKPTTPSGDPIPQKDKHHFGPKADPKPMSTDSFEDEPADAPKAVHGILDFLNKARHLIAAPADQVASTSDYLDEEAPRREVRKPYAEKRRKPAETIQDDIYTNDVTEDDYDDEDDFDDNVYGSISINEDMRELWDDPVPDTKHFNGSVYGRSDSYAEGDAVDFGDDL